MNIASFMIINHPYQNVYFNFLAGKNMSIIKKKFELDYWGLSYKQALEYIVRNDTNKIIKVLPANHPGKINASMLNKIERNKLEFVRSIDDAKYFLSNFRWHKEEYPYDNEFYSIKVDGGKIMVVYKLK